MALLPTLTYGFYPAFLEFPGSVSLSSGTQREAVAEICRSIARHGPRRFYVLNTGISTVPPLAETAELLSREGIRMRYTDLRVAGKAGAGGVGTRSPGESSAGTQSDGSKRVWGAVRAGPVKGRSRILPLG